MARIRFLGQPMPGSEQLGQAIADGIRGAHSIRYGVAWAKGSGLIHLQSHLQDLRERGGTSEIIVGIDANGATWEGLELAIELFTDPYVFYDPGNRTFHPKIFLGKTNETSVFIVGSGNLTQGGLFQNYEGAAVIDLDTSDTEDLSLRTSVDQYFDWLISQAGACQALDASLLERLRADSRQLVSSERERRTREASRRSRDASTPSIFGSAVAGLPRAPRIGTSMEGESDSTLPRRSRLTPTSVTSSNSVVASTTLESTGGSGFFKRLSNNDVSTSSSPGQMIIPVQFIDFFPEMSIERDGTLTGGPRQSAVELPVVFHDGAFVENVFARVIFYEPAATHPRANSELRFTFRNRPILLRLSAGDVLEFREEGETYAVYRLPPGSHNGEHFGWI